MKKLLPLLTTFLMALPCWGAVITAATVPANLTTGTIITATIWNGYVRDFYTYLNTNIVTVMNCLSAKGDLYAYDGAALDNLAVGTNDQVITADSSKTLGLKWATLANTLPLIAKGDLVGYSTANARIPVGGSDGQVLIADSTQALGVKWGAIPAGIPKGQIAAWSPAYAGTSTIPSGWTLCDGNNGSPNLIGKFIIGGRPSGSAATPATGGFGAKTADTTGGAASHTHGAGTVVNVNSGYASLTNGCQDTLPSEANAPYAHTHSVSSTATLNSTSTEPADYALVYMMKL